MNDVQEGLLRIMCDFDKVMRDAGVDYSLDGGTAIGAVRHKGFIPWDDDIDVVLLRRDEEKFLNAMKNLPEDEYFLQKPLSEDWPYLFYKLRLNNTTAIEEKYMNTRIHQGLFIDIFIAEDYPDSFFRRFMYDGLMFGIHVLQTVCDGRLGKPSFDPIQRLIKKAILCITKILDMLPEDDCEWTCERMPWFKVLLKKQYLTDIMDSEFEGHQMRLSAEYDLLLKDLFGDYMQLPPEEDRVPHHLLAFSMDEDYKAWLKNNP